MDSILAIGFLAGIFALGYWIGSMRANLKYFQSITPAAAKPAARKKVTK